MIQISYNRIPRNIENFFPNLFAIEFTFGSITALDADDLKPFPNLAAFTLNNHRITTLDGNFFVHVPRVQAVTFDNNLITNVGKHLLLGLTNLTLASFLDNTCISRVADSPDQLHRLEDKLLELCPPLAETTTLPTTSTTIDECSIRCTINDETDELRNQVEILAEENVMMKQRLLELERRLETIDRISSLSSS